MAVNVLGWVAVAAIIPLGAWIMWLGRDLAYRNQWRETFAARRAAFYMALSGVLLFCGLLPLLGLFFTAQAIPRLGVDPQLPVVLAYCVISLIITLSFRSLLLSPRH